MLNGIAAKILSHLCGQYIEKIDSSQLELEIWNGKVHMENVKIMENSFLAHQIPFRVKCGIISSISLTFPWSKLSTEPCIVDIENLLIVGEVYGGALIAHDLTSQENEDKEEITEQTMWDRMLENILNNLIINIKNVHVRIEANTSIQNYIGIGFVVSSINVFTVNSKGEKIVVKDNDSSIYKKVIVNNFSIYADTESEEILGEDLSSFKTKMIESINSKEHQFILNQFSFDGIFQYNQETGHESVFTMNSKLVELNLDNQQYKGMQILTNQYQLFCKQRIYSQCGRPDRPPRSERSSTLWWCYAHRCSLDKNKWNLIDINGVTQMLKNRSKYFEIWQNYIKNSDAFKDQIFSFEEQFDSNTVTLLRCYSTFIYQKKINSIQDKYTDKEIEVISKQFNESQKIKNVPIIINLNLNALLFSLKQNKSSELLTSFNINNLSVNFVKKGFDNSASFQIQSFYILNFFNKKYPKTAEVMNGLKGSFKINYSKPYQISLSISPIFAIIDAEWIAKIVKFFEKKRTLLDSDDEKEQIHKIQEVIDSHVKLQLDLEIANSKIIVPYQEIDEKKQHSFDLTFNSFELHSTPSPKYITTDVKSLYDNYKIAIKDAQILFANKKMSDKFDFHSSFDVAILMSENFESIKTDFEFTPLNFYLTTFQGLLLNELSKYLIDTIEMSEENTNNANTIAVENKFSIKIPSISLMISYEDKPLYKVEMETQTQMEVINKSNSTSISIIKVESGLSGFEYLTLQNGKFFNTQKFILNAELSPQLNSIALHFGNVELFAKATPLNFLVVFAKCPKNFELKLNLSQQSTIEKYLHKPKSEKSSNQNDKKTKINIKFDNCKAHLIDFNKNNEDELLELKTKAVNVSLEKSLNSFLYNIIIDPPQVTTKQLGEIWKNIVSSDDLMASPINIKIEPASIFIKLDSIKANVSPLLLLKVIKFAKIAKNLHTHKDGDPDTMTFMSFDINAINSKIKIIYNKESRNYYELNVPNLRFLTTEAPMLHQLIIDNIEIIDKNQNLVKKYDDNEMSQLIDKNKLFSTSNLILTVEMSFLFKDFVQSIESKSFNEIIEEKGIENWSEETLDFIKNEKNPMILDDVCFYFYSVSFKFEFDNLLCTYTHNFANDILFLTKSLLEIIKFNSFFNYSLNHIQEYDEPLDINLSFKTQKIDFVVFDEKPEAILTINDTYFKASLQDDSYLLKINKIILAGNHKPKILEAGDLDISLSFDENYASLEYLDILIILEYFPKAINYIMHCPFFSFADEFRKNNAQPTSFDIKSSNFFAINRLNLKLPLKNNLFVFNTAFDASLNSEGKIAQIREIQMLLNDRIIIKPFSINFDNDKWIIDPVLITFSVFELNIIEQFIENIKSLSMPDIYISKKEVEMSRRKFAIYTSTVKFILTQPNLPFLWLEINPSIFKQSFNDKNGGEKIMEFKIESLIKHANYSNCGFDTVVDPFVLTLQCQESSKSKNVNIEISPITFSISSSFLKEIFVFRKKFAMITSSKDDSKLFQDEIIFFKNDTGLPITITLFNKGTKKIKISGNDEDDEDEGEGEIIVLSDGIPYKLNNFNPEYDIKVNFLNNTAYFSIKDLCFPIFFKNNAVAYIVADIGVQTIHFSSPFIIRNELPYNIEVFIGKDNIGVVKSESEKPIPLNSTKNLSEGIRAAMSPIRTEISPAVSIVKFHSSTLLYKIIENGAFRDLYSTIYVSVNPKKSISYITFSPNISIYNHLPVKVKLTFLDNFELNPGKNVFEIETGKSIDASFIRDTSSKAPKNIKLSIDQFGESDPTAIYPFESNQVPFEFTIKNQQDQITCKVAVMSIYIPEKMVYQIIIFTPCVMFNETGVSLCIQESKKSTFQFPFINKMLLYTPINFFKKKKVTSRASFLNHTLPNKHSFDCMHVGTLQTVPLPYIDDPNTFLHLSVATTEAPLQFNYTTIVTLTTAISIVNHFNETVYFMPSDTYKYINSCEPHVKTPLLYSSMYSYFDVFVKGYKKCKKVFLSSPTILVFRLLNEQKGQPDFLIQLDLIKEDNGFCGHLSYPSLPTPLVITNMLRNKLIYAYQDDVLISSPTEINDKKKNLQFLNENAIVVNNMSTSIFAKVQPFLELDLANRNKIFFNINNNLNFSVSFTSDAPPTRIESTKYFYEVRTTKRGNQMIIVTEEETNNSNNDNNNNNNSNNNNNNNSNSNDKIDDLSKKQIINKVLFTKMQFSLIDSLMHEICLLTFDKIEIKENRKDELIQLTIDKIQLDDMYVAAKTPVALFVSHPKFLRATLKTGLPLRMHSFDSIDIYFEQIHILADYAFISDLYSVIKEIIEESKLAIDYSPVMKFKKPKKKEMDNPWDAQSKENDNNNKEDEIFRSSTFYSIKSFIVSPIVIKLNYRGSSGRQFIHPPAQDFKISMMKYVPNVSGANISLPLFEIKGIRAPFSTIRKHIIGAYRNQFIKEGVKVALHADLLFNVVGVAKGVVDVFTDKTKSTKETLSNLGGQLLQSVEGIVRILPSNIHLANPSKSSKPSRFSKFIGSVANVLDKGADKINSTKQELIDEYVPPPQRQARAFPMGRIIRVTPSINMVKIEGNEPNIDNNDEDYHGLISEFSSESSLRFSIVQNTFQKLFKSKPDHANERLLAFIDSEKENSFALAIFDHYIGVLSSNLLVVTIESKISNIVSIDFKGTTVNLVIFNKDNDIESFSFTCKTEREARSIVTIITSIAARMNLFSE